VKSTDFYRQILGISAPWKIVNLELIMEISDEWETGKIYLQPETKKQPD
jgi:hypothetical protein